MTRLGAEAKLHCEQEAAMSELVFGLRKRLKGARGSREEV